jgi:hypothetical protein
MDDPWANAWGEPTNPVSGGPIVSSSWNLATQTHFPEHEQEADIGMPSWSTGAGVPWNEPSAAGNSLWSQPTPARQLWEPSPYDQIPIGRSTFEKPPSLPRTPSPKEDHVGKASYSPELLPLPHLIPEEVVSIPVSRESSPRSDSDLPVSAPGPSESRPESPDAFGTFESAVTEAPWVSTAAPSSTLEEWGSTWESESSKVVQERQAPLDEWEAAKRQKDEQDRQKAEQDRQVVSFVFPFSKSVGSLDASHLSFWHLYSCDSKNSHKNYGQITIALRDREWSRTKNVAICEDWMVSRVCK